MFAETVRQDVEIFDYRRIDSAANWNTHVLLIKHCVDHWIVDIAALQDKFST